MAWDELSDEQREIRDLVRTIARERIAPRAAEIDESHEFPWDVVELYRENDIFGLFFDEQYGGLGTGTLLALIAIEEISKVCATSGLILAVQELGSLGLKLAGSDEQKKRYLPKLASGEWLCAYALTSQTARLGMGDRLCRRPNEVRRLTIYRQPTRLAKPLTRLLARALLSSTYLAWCASWLQLTPRC